jgi:hypothetical protein
MTHVPPGRHLVWICCACVDAAIADHDQPPTSSLGELFAL